MILLPFAFAAEDFEDYRFYLGDLHAHTGYSGDAGSSDIGTSCPQCGAFASVFQLAQDNNLDFLALTDHTNGPPSTTAAGYAALTNAVLATNDPEGGFITIPAAEVWFTTATATLGHKTLLFFGENTALSTLNILDTRPTGSANTRVPSCSTIWTWLDNLEADFGPVLALPHHPGMVTPMPTDWSCHNSYYQPAVEIYSEHGNSLDEDSPYDPPSNFSKWHSSKRLKQL
jgi:hypothetical protein